MQPTLATKMMSCHATCTLTGTITSHVLDESWRRDRRERLGQEVARRKVRLGAEHGSARLGSGAKDQYLAKFWRSTINDDCTKTSSGKLLTEVEMP